MESALLDVSIRSIKLIINNFGAQSEASTGRLELVGVRQVVSDLQNEFESLQGFLKDAEKRQEEEMIVRKWMSSIKDLAYEAHVITEKHLNPIKRHRRTQGSGGNFSSNLLRELLSPIDTMVLARDSSRIYSLTNKISRLTSKMKAYGIEFTPLVDPPSPASIADNVGSVDLAAEEDESFVVGLDDDVKEIENQLICTESPKVVIGICGANGLGKTTLVRKVLRTSTLVKEHFDVIFWAHLGSECQTGEILRRMLLHLQGTAGRDVTIAGVEEEDINTVCELVSKILIEKRCLLVLDDLQTGWDDTFRSALSSIFHPPAHSKVIITTCSASLLTSVHPQAFLHQPRCLTSEEMWLLFQCKTALLGQGIPGKVVKSIGKRCLKDGFIGLPFSILVLAGIFAYETGHVLFAVYLEVLTKPIPLRMPLVVRSGMVSLTNRIKPSIKSALFGPKTNEIGIQQVLELSYETLPIHLRLCLAEMSNHCPEDGNKISTEELYRLWIDQQIVKPGRRASEEEVAEGYLDELVKRSLVQVVEMDRATGKTRSCQLNSLVRDFYRLKATTPGPGSIWDKISSLCI